MEYFALIFKFCFHNLLIHVPNEKLENKESCVFLF